MSNSQRDLNTVGYTLLAADNGSDMWDSGDSVRQRCLRCGFVLEFMQTNPEYKPPRRFRPVYAKGLEVGPKTAMSTTYDGATIVSRAFRDFCEQQGYSDLEFREFKDDPSNFHFVVQRTLAYDYTRRGTKFDKFCEECRNYKSVVIAHPAMLLLAEPLADAIYGSDLLFGSGDAKHRLIIVGVETRRKMRERGLKGITFEPAYGL